MTTHKADITEVFSSIQGEGIFLGARQIFVRFKACNMNCVFCDERKNLGSKEYTPSELMRLVRLLERTNRPHHSVSLTGGEPLLYAEFLREFLILLKKEDMKSYLETNGTLPDVLKGIIDLVDIVAMDFKLPSSTGEREYWLEHQKFLKVASKKKVFVKAVVTPNTREEDIRRAAELVKKIDRDISFILQPATPTRLHDRIIDNATLLGFLDIASRSNLENIRVIPQIHKILNVK